MAKWHFREHNGHDDINQSTSAEAFEGSALKDLATSVVRESLQNVLDVTLDKSKPARVRFTIGNRSSHNATKSEWFENLMQHLQQPGAGVPEAPKPDEQCDFLLIEDFNTLGLVGDYRAPYAPGTENNFLNFLYHDGLTGKVKKKLGSRGVGKIVLLLASRARTFFAYTIRAGDPTGTPLLVGKSLLKFRKAGDLYYEPAGYFVESWLKGKPREPVADANLLAKFKNEFTLSRSVETGLSVVIPYLDPSITRTELRRAVVEEYHFAILSGRLVVELAEGSSVEMIDASQIPDVDDADLSARVELARYAIENPEPTLQTGAPAANNLQRLTDNLVPDDVRKAVLDALNNHECIAVRCNLHIHPKDEMPVNTFCDVYIKHAENVHQRPVFVRELLPISGVGKSCSQLRSLVLIRPGPLADLLRTAEGANHTEWSPRTDNFKKGYRARLGEIEFVSSSVNRLVEIARGNASEAVGGISTFFFSTPLDDEGGKSKQKGKRESGPKPEIPNVPEVETEPVGYLFSQESGGFTIRGDPDTPRPKRITVRVAYDVIRGSPWSDYDPDDFDFRKRRNDVSVIANGAEVERPDPGNRLIIKPTSDDFAVVVSGFSESLDLIVEHRSDSSKTRKQKVEPNASETAELHQPQ